jgi:hypothetical protein
LIGLGSLISCLIVRCLILYGAMLLYFCAGDFVASVYFSHVPPVSDIWLHFPIDDMYVRSMWQKLVLLWPLRPVRLNPGCNNCVDSEV